MINWLWVMSMCHVYFCLSTTWRSNLPMILRVMLILVPLRLGDPGTMYEDEKKRKEAEAAAFRAEVLAKAKPPKGRAPSGYKPHHAHRNRKFVSPVKERISRDFLFLTRALLSNVCNPMCLLVIRSVRAWLLFYVLWAVFAKLSFPNHMRMIQPY